MEFLLNSFIFYEEFLLVASSSVIIDISHVHPVIYVVVRTKYLVVSLCSRL
jgi:hypothetical protein